MFRRLRPLVRPLVMPWVWCAAGVGAATVLCPPTSLFDPPSGLPLAVGARAARPDEVPGRTLELFWNPRTGLTKGRTPGHEWTAGSAGAGLFLWVKRDRNLTRAAAAVSVWWSLGVPAAWSALLTWRRFRRDRAAAPTA